MRSGESHARLTWENRLAGKAKQLSIRGSIRRLIGRVSWRELVEGRARIFCEHLLRELSIQETSTGIFESISLANPLRILFKKSRKFLVSFL